MARLAVVIGDPTGIGPEVVAKALKTAPPKDLLVIGDSTVWREAQRVAQVAMPARAATQPGGIDWRGVPFQDVTPAERGWDIGKVSPAAGRAAALWLDQAVHLALTGVVDAVVFAPFNKQALILADHDVHDEYDLIAQLAAVRSHAEMNVVPHPAGRGLLWVARATSHVRFRDISENLTKSCVVDTIRSAHHAAASSGTKDPKVGVAALNPHAGEGGLLGNEEESIIRPAIETGRAEGINVSGPYPADRIFLMAQTGRFDAVVAMYHDQAQIATKLMASGRGVTVGMGFPFVLTTPSHGTAFDIVGKGVADPGSMIHALYLAEVLAENMKEKSPPRRP
jgi:4-hydroxythreonine-4-phosphate dehydrogenase